MRSSPRWKSLTVWTPPAFPTRSRAFGLRSRAPRKCSNRFRSAALRRGRALAFEKLRRKKMTGAVPFARSFAPQRETHQRLHRHAGLSAAARGAIGLDDYRQLLMRLYGFHLAFEDTHASAMQKLGFIASSRAELIALDLAALGIKRFDVSRLPRCAALRQPSSEACALGALYVVEGSALGGALIAEALAPVVGEARRFFLGGPSRPAVWPSLLARVETLAPGRATRQRNRRRRRDVSDLRRVDARLARRPVLPRSLGGQLRQRN